MKIAWFTPFVRQSAIGKIGALICEKLAENHEVEIWTQHTEDLIETSVPVTSFRIEDFSDISEQYDYIFYNFGNFAGYHREIMEASQKCPGIVILHDQTMLGFWGQYYCMPEFGGKGDQGAAGFIEMMRCCYGKQAEEATQAAVESGVYPFYSYGSMEGYSCLEPSLRGAAGVFTHAKFFARQLETITNLPVGVSYLPCQLPRGNYSSRLLEPILQKARRQGRKIIVSTGIVHPVKRIDKVAEVLQEHPNLAKQICYLVIGDCGGPYGEKLKTYSDGQLADCMYLMGYQPDEVMEAALAACDMAVNLRFPNSEVCSLSLWEQMSFGKPVLVLDQGVYREVPSDAVVRITLEAEKDGIYQALTDLAGGKEFTSEGTKARAFIEERCSVSEYCSRLLQFAGEVKTSKSVADLQNKVLSDVGRRMNALGICERALPASYAAVVDELSKILGGASVPEVENKTIGVWIGFPYFVPSLSREGISRLMGYLISSLLKYYPDVRAEVWCYSFNEEEVRISFASVREEDQKRIQFITEKNWAEALEATTAQRTRVGEINETIDNLICAARAAAKASVFVPLILYLDRVAEVGKKILVPGYDMAVAEHYAEFIEEDSNYIARNLDYIWRAENMAARGGVFFCISDTVRQSGILKYVRNLKKADTAVIYQTPNVPENMENKFLSEAQLRKRFSLHGPYLFYPTQIRPYKNISTLVRAFGILAKEYPDLKLVLTGEPKDIPEVDHLLTKLRLYPRTFLLKGVSEPELYSLYRCAAAVPMTSIHEGGFPYQAVEALFTNTPLVASDIPNMIERIHSLGFTVESSQIPLFSRLDPEDLADKLRIVLEDREAAIQRQKPFADCVMSYTWKEAAAEYYQLFFGVNG